MTRKRLSTVFITRNGQPTEAASRWRTIGRPDVDTLRVFPDDMQNEEGIALSD